MVFEITLYRMGIFFLILMTGFVCSKLGVIRKDYLPDLARPVMKVFLPVLIFENTVASTTRDTLFANWPVLVFAVATMTASVVTIPIVQLLAFM